MIVADASTVIEVILNTSDGEEIAARLLDPTVTIAAPSLIDIEVLQVLRRYNLAGDLDAARGDQAVEDFLALPIVRYPHELFVFRIWDLRHNLTAYDAAYVSLAEALDAPLLTRDARIAGVPGNDAHVELV